MVTKIQHSKFQCLPPPSSTYNNQCLTLQISHMTILINNYSLSLYFMKETAVCATVSSNLYMKLNLVSKNCPLLTMWQREILAEM